jgi:DNA-binding XRE family transcriptional regulator
MIEITNNRWYAMSDAALMKSMGSFIKHHRLEQNKTQMMLAEEAGINRATLSSIEKGVNSNIITYIQLLRAMELLHLLQVFQVEQQISPIQLARREKLSRKRASRKINSKSKPKSDW